MKNIIYNNYNILVYDIKKELDNYFFYYNNELYVFYLVLNDIENLKESYHDVLKLNIDCFKIVLNNNNELTTKIDNKNYALLKMNGILNYEYKIIDFKIHNINKAGINWGKLWGSRLDYYESQIRELAKSYQTVLSSYGLYHGIAENAILYFNLSINKFNDGSSVAIMHNRVKYPCYLKDYNNPVNFVIDYSVRDVSEYIKSYMLSNDYNIENIFEILNSYKYSKLMFNLLYSRLLYPSFYFDIFDNIILDDGVDSDIVKVLNYSSRYLNMLKEIYDNYSNKYEMFKIEWLDKIKM